MDLTTTTNTACVSLREPGAILLISCYELGHQPLGIAQPLGLLEEAGYQPAALDIAVEPFDEERIQRARFIGISVPMHTALRLGVRVSGLVRRYNPGCHICFYGLYASLNAEYLLEHFADTVIGGEYERPLLELIDAFEKDRAAVATLDGVSHRGRTVEPFLTRLPALLPPPSRTGLPPLHRYARLQLDGHEGLVGYVEASRGCLHHCLHCPIVPVYNGRFFLVPEDSVLQDIRQLVKARATHMTFGDPDFLNGPGHSMRIVRAMHAEFPHLTFDCTAKIEHILKRRSLLPELAELGCLFLISAVESFSNTVLDCLKKGHTQTDVITALEAVRSAGITLRPSLVAFTPWTTLNDYVEMFEIVESNDLIDAIDPVQYTIRLLIPPGSALLEHSDIHRYLRGLSQTNFQYHWFHPDPRMDTLHAQVNKAVQEAGSTEDSEMIFERLRAMAEAVAGVRHARPARRRSPINRKAPRLTEPWFCCAEPTDEQFRPLHTEGSGGGSSRTGPPPAMKGHGEI